MRKRILIIAGLFAIVGIAGWVAFQCLPREPKLSVTFLGYTNDVTGTRLATLVVSNLSSFVVRRQAAYWIELPAPAGGTNRAGRWYSSSNDLKARAFEILAVPVPTNQPSWRVLLYIRTDLGPLTEMIDDVEFMMFGFQSRFPRRRKYELRSDWMEN
jgi:hypothetical protein